MTPTGNRYRAFMQAVLRAALVLGLFPCAFPLASQNLVPNPGFEEADTCSSMSFGIEGPLHWFSANGSPDHHQSCLPYGAFNGLPMNFFTFQETYEGLSCAGLYTYHQNGQAEYREWIMAPLLEPLVVG